MICSSKDKDCMYAIILWATIFNPEASSEGYHVNANVNASFFDDLATKEFCPSGDCVNSTEEILTKLSLVYSDWSPWSKCRNNGMGEMVISRQRACKIPRICQDITIKEEKKCTPSKQNHDGVIWKRTKINYSTGQGFYVITSDEHKFVKKMGVNLLKQLDKRKASKRVYYSKWSRWTICTRSCFTQRYRWCKNVELCGNEVIRQTAYCYTDGSFCESWVNSKIPLYEIVPEEKQSSLNDVRSDIIPFPGPALESTAPQLETNRQCGALYSRANYSLAPQVNHMLKIIGGKASNSGKWPWIVAVLNRRKEPICGGTLVSQKWVLTAAHCIKRRLYVTIGEHNLAMNEGHELTLRVKRAVIHPQFNPATVDNDVAMLKISANLSQPTLQMPACLPQIKQILPTKRLCTIIGWGKRSSADSYGTDILQEAHVPIVSTQACRLVYDEYQVITNNMFCAGYKRGRMDTCSGDSGGPLLCKDEANRWIVYGITSFGEGCGRRGKYGIYTRVPNYVKWIQSVINDEN